jgi:hypothetical protein
LTKLNRKLLLIVVIFTLISNYLWLCWDTRYFHGIFLGTGEHLVTISKFYRILKYNIGDFINGFLYTERIYPPVSYIASALLMLIQPVPDMAAFANTLFFLGTILCCYFIGKKLYDPVIAILSAIFLSLFPLGYAFSRIVCVDIALMFFVTLSVLIMFHTDNFSRSKLSILLGFISGIGMLVKWVFPFFLIGPILFSIVLSLKEAKNKIFKKAINFILFALVISGASFPWYIANFEKIRDFARFQSALVVKTSAMNLLFSKLFFFMLIRLPNIIGMPVCILFFLGIYYVISKKDKNGLLLLSLYVLPYIIFATFYARTDRYFLPALPSLAIISVNGLKEFSFWIFFHFKRKEVIESSTEKKIILFSFLPFVIFGMVSMLAFSFPITGNDNSLEKFLYMVNFPEFASYNPLAAEPQPPYPLMIAKGEEHIEDADKLINVIRNQVQGKKELNLLLMPFNGYISGDLIRFLINSKNLNWQIPPEHHYEVWKDNYYQLILKADVIVINPVSPFYMKWLKEKRNDYLRYLLSAKNIVINIKPVLSSHFKENENLLIANKTSCRVYFRTTSETAAEEFELIIGALRMDRTNRLALQDLNRFKEDQKKIEEAINEIQSFQIESSVNPELENLVIILRKVREIGINPLFNTEEIAVHEQNNLIIAKPEEKMKQIELPVR